MLRGSFLFLVAFPIFLVLILVWKKRNHGWQKMFWYSLFFWYTVFALSILYFPLPYQGEIIADRINDNFEKNQWVPFFSIYTIWATQAKSMFLIQIIGNIILTVPLGFLLPIVNKSFRNFKTIALFAIFIPIIIELLQYIISIGLGFTYKITDVDDIILNFLGLMIGFATWKIVSRHCGSYLSTELSEKQ